MSKLNKDTKPKPLDIMSLAKEDKESLKGYKIMPYKKKKAISSRNIKSRRDKNK